MKNLKKNFSLFICSLFYLTSIAQEKGDLIILNTPTSSIDVKPMVAGETITKKANFLKSGIKFKVIEMTDKEVKLKALDFEKLTKKQKDDYLKVYGEEKEDLGELYNNKIYIVSRDNFNINAKKFVPRERLSIGLLTLPFKARPQDDFSFDTEFNINSTLNWSFAYTNNVSINWQIGAGIGTVGLNTSNSLGLEDDEAQDVSTITFLTGLMLQYNKVQAGIYVGVDHINNQSNYQWQSNGNMWFGFGIGYDLFNLSLAKESNNQN